MEETTNGHQQYQNLPSQTPRLVEILGKLASHKGTLSREYHIAQLGVFGSHVRGEAQEGSDVDILVEFHETPTLFQFVRLQRLLGELLGVPVDLVMKSGLKPRIGKRILDEVVSV